ncbi:MAG: hypothetical protein IT428_31415 [Planctomycetaceae bacterium]|nr:hypothetical protein [Planctomycetaceae bacterium]
MKIVLAITALAVGVESSAIAGNPYCGHSYGYAKPYVAPYVAPAYAPPVVHKEYVPIIVKVPVAYEKPIALQGNTYYSYTKAAEPYQPLDALYFDKAARYLELSASVQQSGQDAFNSSLQAKIQADKEVAEAHLAANGMAAFAKEFFAGQARLKALSQQQGPPPGVFRSTSEPKSEDAVISTFCTKCHASADFVKTPFKELSLQRQEQVVGRVAGVFEDENGETVHDESKRMPLAADGKSPGKPLPMKYQRLLQQAMRQE